MDKLIEDAIEAIRESSPDTSIYLGCDSIRYKKNGAWKARYSTIVVIHMGSKHGAKILHHTEVIDDYGNLKQRLLNEVAYVTSVATSLVDHLDGRRMEVHLDINSSPAHKSHIAVKEALGWCMGLGLDAKVKPDAWAASHAADHCVRHMQ